MKSLVGTTFDLTGSDMSTERINGGAGAQSPGWSVRFRHVWQKKPNEVPVSTWDRTSLGLPVVIHGAPAGIHDRMCMERVCSLPTVLVLVATHALVAKFGRRA